MLTYINALDQRMNTDDVKVMAWFDAFPPDMEYEWAQGFAGKFQTTLTDMLTPADLVQGWAAEKRKRAERHAALAITGTEVERGSNPMPEWMSAAYREVLAKTGTGRPTVGTQDRIDALAAAAGVDLDAVRRDLHRSEHAGREAECSWAECRCSHTSPCYKGWIDSPDGTTTAPCPNCRPSLSGVLQFVGGPGQRTAADGALIRNRQSRTEFDPEQM